MAFKPDQFTNGYINGFGLSRNAVTPSSKIDIAAGQCADGGNTLLITTSAVTTVDITVAGTNGLDTGAEAASTLYALWIIRKDDGTTSGLLSVSFTAPTMPSGYTTKRRIGSWFNDGSSNFLAATQVGTGRERTVRFKAEFQLIFDNQPIASSYTTFAAVGGANAAGMRISGKHVWISSTGSPRRIDFSEDAGTTTLAALIVGDLANLRESFAMDLFPDSSGNLAYRGQDATHAADLTYECYQLGYTEWL